MIYQLQVICSQMKVCTDTSPLLMGSVGGVMCLVIVESKRERERERERERDHGHCTLNLLELLARTGRDSTNTV